MPEMFAQIGISNLYYIPIPPIAHIEDSTLTAPLVTKTDLI